MPVDIRPDASHRVVLRRPHGDEFGYRIDTYEIASQLRHVSQIGLEMLFAQMPDVEPQEVVARLLDPEALSHVLHHAARDDVSGR
jgi:hypothetical protein